jgi:hypothetical protein
MGQLCSRFWEATRRVSDEMEAIATINDRDGVVHGS